MRVVALVVALTACVHAALWGLGRTQTEAPQFNGHLTSVSYSPYARSSHPDKDEPPSVADIRADLKVISPHTNAIRLYSATGGVERVPAVASEFGLKVTAGAWLDGDTFRNNEKLAAADKKLPERNNKELKEIVRLARENRNIRAIVVGNEAIYRADTILIDDETGLDPEEQNRIERAKEEDKRRVIEDINVARLIRVIHKVKREVQVPVSTGEVWHVWRDHPELVSAVDFIAVHILPYWEGKSYKAAVEDAIGGYNKLREMYPGKRIVIAEFGWPSAGYNKLNAVPGRIEQAAVLRDFVAKADAFGIDYNIVEAIDQPWKVNEGSVGAYWGLFDASRNSKFAWSGPVAERDYWKVAGVALLVGFLLSLPVLALAGATFAQAALLSGAAHAVGAWVATVFAFWTGHYFVWGAIFALAVGMILLIPLVIIAMSRVEDIAAIAFGRKGRRLLAPPPATALENGFAPKVSIHIPAYREQPEMLKLTLDAVSRLTYPNFECVVIINNTPDPAFWQPIEEHCRTLGDRFKFINAEKIEGFKAGALRLAMTRTAPDAEIIGVIDADYMVEPNWLTDLVPAFADPKVGLVQAPQDHRDGSRSVMHKVMNAEYAGFFDIGMVERNETNSIITHGTMCLIRRAALDAAGGWSSDTICEDTDLGLTILELGWRAHYTNRRYGYGLLPDTYEAFKKQRHRWAYGGFQIIKKHWRRFLPGASHLTREQKRDFVLGWINWLGAESIGVLMAVLNLIWVPVVVFVGIAIPDKILTLPILAAFAVSLGHFATLYRLRVPISISQTAGAAVAAMSVQLTVARAVGDGLIKDHLPFTVTAKGGAARKGRKFQAFWESILGGLLLLGALLLVATNTLAIREITIFALVLVVQSLPFLAAAGIALLEGSRANDFAFWRGLEARVGELVTRRRATIAKAAVVEKRVEAAQ